MLIPKTMKRLPYGISDYEKIVNEGLYYVDKTSFIPVLEGAAWYVFLIRPRRFGKSLWVSVLENYYDINKKDRFDDLFGHTWIGRHPTDERNSYLILTLNFSLVNPDPEQVRASFEDNGATMIRDFLARYDRFFPEKNQTSVMAHAGVADQLRELMVQAARLDLKIYLFIDEYDNFANTILSTAGADAYHELTRGAGFFRHFFNLLKGGTGRSDAGFARLFITGVSPVTMDDVTSGFNIGDQISLANYANEMIGFTAGDVREILFYYRDNGMLPSGTDTDACLSLMSRWYDQYRFSATADTSMFNSDMILYFLKKLIMEEEIPKELIDQNIRMDYGKLRHLILVDRRLNGNFSELKQIIDTGRTVSAVSSGFPLESLKQRENFLSLLFYFGLLSFHGSEKGRPLLKIPNQTVRRLMYGYIRDALRDVDVFQVDIRQFGLLMGDMAYDGRWRPVFEFLAGEVKRQTAIRDYLEGEKMIQGFLLAYLNISDYFLTRPEQELNKGYTDLWLEPFMTVYPDMGFGYLIELKYIPRKDFSSDLLALKVAEAEKQVNRYAEDETIRRMAGRVSIKRLVMIYSGWEMVYCEECRGAGGNS